MRDLIGKSSFRGRKSMSLDRGDFNEAEADTAVNLPHVGNLAARLISGIYDKVDFKTRDEGIDETFLGLLRAEAPIEGLAFFERTKDGDAWRLRSHLDFWEGQPEFEELDKDMPANWFQVRNLPPSAAGSATGPVYWAQADNLALLLQRKKDENGSDNELGEVIKAILKLYADLVERKQIYREIFQSELRLRSMQENIPVGIYRSDREGRLVSCNPALFRMLGYNSEMELMEHSTWDHYVDSGDRRSLIEKLEKDGAVRDMEFQLRRKDGLVFWASTTARAFYGVGNVLAYYDGSITDITQRKMHEEERSRSYEILSQAMDGTVEAILRISEVRDPYTAGHQQRVAALAREIARELGMDQSRAQGVYVAGVLHDIGKIYVPSEILTKPGKITKLEYNVLKTHAEVGYDILKSVNFPWPIAEMVWQHHERLDGSGYPRGLRSADISLEARILAVADVVEAMVSHRPYRAAHCLKEALEEIKQGRGILYDSSVADACLRLFQEKNFEFESIDIYMNSGPKKEA